MAQHHHQHNPSLLLDGLYCSEEHWEDQAVYEDYTQDELEQVDECFLGNLTQLNSPTTLLQQDLVWDNQELSSLLAKQHQNPLCTLLETNPVLAAARSDAVQWMLKVSAHHSFSLLTPVLAVNYLDRFLASFHFQKGKPWMTQLAAVSCLFLAAKVEETRLPLLLHLQVGAEQSRYVFEAKTITRMEILVLSALGWRMNPVTPVSFLDYIARRVGLKGYLCWEFLKRCEPVLLSVIADSKFISYLPSVLATATMMHVVNNWVEPSLRVNQNQLLDILGVNQEDKVEGCYKLVLETERKASNKRKFGWTPSSPNGVMDASFSSDCDRDSSNDSWAVEAPVSSSPDPLSKKTRIQHQLLLNHSNSDFLTISL